MGHDGMGVTVQVAIKLVVTEQVATVPITIDQVSMEHLTTKHPTMKRVSFRAMKGVSCSKTWLLITSAI